MLLSTLGDLWHLPFLEKLKLEWVWFGIDAPAIAWLAAVLVLECLVFALGRLIWVYQSEKRHLGQVTRLLRKLADSAGRRPGEGASLAQLDSARRIFEEAREPILLAVWQRFESTLITRPGEANPSYLAEEETRKVFTVKALLAERMNIDFYMALPGVLTGIGLCATFIALLVALLDVRLQGTRVQGMDLLIQGLSGKFLSSIAALLSATVLIVAEKSIFHHLQRRVDDLTAQLDRIFPRLTTGQILMLVHRDIREQALAFSHFNTDLATKLKNGVSEGVTPMMGRMIEGIESMTTVLSSAEASKKDSMAGEIRGALDELQRSLNNTLQQMGQSFTSSLSGSAMNQFEALGQGLKGASSTIEAMSSQLSDVVQFARTSTQEQMALGRSQVEELTTVLRELMKQMSESASSSLGSMTFSLGQIVDDLSTRVSDLSGHLAVTVADASQKATTAASDVVVQVARWSESNERQLGELLERHAKQLDRIAELRVALDNSAVLFSNTIGQSARMFEDLKALSAGATRSVALIEAAGRGIGEAQIGFRDVARSAATQIEHLDATTKSHKETWASMSSTLGAYEEAFDKVQRSSASVLQDINTGAAQFSNITKDHFQSYAKLSNEALSDAVQKMGAIVDDLNELLDEVKDLLANLLAAGKVPPAPVPRSPTR